MLSRGAGSLSPLFLLLACNTTSSRGVLVLNDGAGGETTAGQGGADTESVAGSGGEDDAAGGSAQSAGAAGELGAGASPGSLNTPPNISSVSSVVVPLDAPSAELE